MKKISLLLLLLLVSSHSFSQSGFITLDSCFSLLEKNYPASKKIELLQNEKRLAVDNVKKEYLPSFDISADLSYQSDVTTFPYNLREVGFSVNPEVFGGSGDAFMIYPEISDFIAQPVENHVHYGVNIDINQKIFDGGITRKKAVLTTADYDYQMCSVNVEVDKIKPVVAEMFFSIALIDGYIEQLTLAKEKLVSRREVVKIAVKNGAVLPTDLDLIDVEILKIEGSVSERKIQKKMAVRSLKQLLNVDIKETDSIVLPDIEIKTNAQLNRSELKLFEYSEEKLVAVDNLYANVFPSITGYVRGGYGNPGMNLFSNKMHPYFIVGATINWKLWDWEKTKSEREIITIQRDKLALEKDAFKVGVNVSSNKYLDEIERYQMLLSKDSEIIKLMESISQSAESKYNNGGITFSEYYERVNAEMNSKIEQNTHNIMLIRAKANYLLNLGIY
jgi:hypothetical protein